MLNKIILSGAFLVGFSLAYTAAPAFAQVDDGGDIELPSGLEGVQLLVIDEIVDRSECDSDEAEKLARKVHSNGLKQLGRFFRERISKKDFIDAVLEELDAVCGDEDIGDEEPVDEDPGMDPPPQ